MTLNLFAYLVRFLLLYPLNLNIWAMFCSLGLFADADCIFHITCAKAVNTYTIMLFCSLSGELFSLSPGWFIFEDWFEG